MTKVGAILIANGNLLHRLTQATANAQSPLCLDVVLGTVKSSRSLDLRDLVSIMTYKDVCKNKMERGYRWI